MTKSRGILPPRHVRTEAEDAAVRTRYPTETASVIARDLGVDLQVLYARAQRLKVAKSPDFYASPASGRLDGLRGASSRFEKGNVPWTKGKRGLHLSPSTEFKPGMRPVNYMEVGTEKMHVGYVWVKVADGGWPQSWRPKHHVIWEAATQRQIPAGHILSFIDRDRRNFDIANMELMSKAEWLARHTIHNLPKDLADLMRLQGVLNRQINRRSKNA